MNGKFGVHSTARSKINRSGIHFECKKPVFEAVLELAYVAHAHNLYTLDVCFCRP